MHTCGFARFHFLEFSQRIAAKDHLCVECRKIIIVGQAHWKGAGAWSDQNGQKQFRALRLCQLCQDDWDTLHDLEFENRDCLSLCHGHLQDHIETLLNEEIIDGEHILVDRWFPSRWSPLSGVGHA